jgi:excisionase family DNA binding protein
MKPGNTQFDMRENPASLGQHDSRFAGHEVTGPSARASAKERENSQATSVASQRQTTLQSLNNAAYTAATGGMEQARAANEPHSASRTFNQEGAVALNSDARQRDELPLTVREAAKFLGVSPQTVYLWVERKQIPHLRVMGRNIRFLKSDLEPFRASFKQEMENE